MRAIVIDGQCTVSERAYAVADSKCKNAQYKAKCYNIAFPDGSVDVVAGRGGGAHPNTAPQTFYGSNLKGKQK